MRTRSAKEEGFLYRMLDQLDREQEERRVKLEKKVAKARKQMGVGKEQPSIMTKMRRAPKEVAVKDIPVGGDSPPTGHPQWQS